MAEQTMLQEAIDAIDNGEKARPRDLLTRLLKTDPANPNYWLWLSAVVESSKERIYCLQEVLKRDPKNPSARRGLIMMGAMAPDEPQRIGAGIKQRRWQVDYGDIAEAPKLITRKTLPWILLLVAGALTVVALVVLGVVGVKKPRSTIISSYIVITAGPSPTYQITNTAVVRSATPTFVGPTPLWMMLKATYTPTLIYVNTPHPLSEAYRAGIRAFQRGDYPAMLNFMKQVLDNEPTSADVYYYLGEGYLAMTDYPQALDSYNQAIKNNPSFAPAYLGRARTRSMMDSQADVFDDLDKALELDPGLLEAVLEEAHIMVQQGRGEDTLALLDPLQEKLAESPLFYLYRAQAYLLVENNDQALADVQTANELDITLLPAYLVMGEVQQAEGNMTASIDPIQTYLRYVPEDVQALVLLGKAYVASQQNQEAVDAFSAALKLNNRLFDAYLQRGLVYLAQGEGTKALDDLTIASKMDSESVDAAIGVGRAYLVLGYDGDAYLQIERTQSIVKLDADWAKLHYWRAMTLDRLKRFDVAAKDWQALLELPSDVVPTDWAREARLKLEEFYTRTPTVTATSTQTLTRTSTPKKVTVTGTPGKTSTKAVTPTPTKSLTPTP